MKPKKVNDIMKRVMKEWYKRYGEGKIDPEKVNAVRDMLLLSQYEDGFMRVQMIDGGEDVYLVPFEDIILDGLKGEEIEKKYEKAKN